MKEGTNPCSGGCCRTGGHGWGHAAAGTEEVPEKAGAVHIHPARGACEQNRLLEEKEKFK